MPKSTLSNISFSIRGRPRATELERTKDDPGPGHYDSLPRLNSSKKYLISTMKKY